MRAPLLTSLAAAAVVLGVALDAGRAAACSLAPLPPPSRHAVLAPEQPVGPVVVERVTVLRSPIRTRCRTSCDGLATIEIVLTKPDRRSYCAGDFDYHLQVVGGVAPLPIAGDSGASCLSRGGQPEGGAYLFFFWDDAAPRVPFSFDLQIAAVDSLGRTGLPSVVRVASDGSPPPGDPDAICNQGPPPPAGDTAGGCAMIPEPGRARASPLLLFAVALGVRRRRRR
jgi:hypothetical protein